MDMTLTPNGTLNANLPEVKGENRRYRSIQSTAYPDRKPSREVWWRYIHMVAGKLHHTAKEYEIIERQIR